MTGFGFFRATARLHVRATPPKSPLLFEYGRDFPAFVQSFEHAQDMPRLADAARIERGRLGAYHAADARPCRPTSLPPCRPTGLVAWHSCRILRPASCDLAIWLSPFSPRTASAARSRRFDRAPPRTRLSPGGRSTSRSGSCRPASPHS
ncbi:putative DNA-binding domain-containing protein [Rhodopseudomonas sp. BAL398]|uniref:HvfC/BufC family peptide modification chaperone n=1 Tax=Rhodopseudomonas sp. BAL398 TaxID=3034676 RepID=UPI00294B8811|nr:putative DNA-binding domain-containing protein [Rhodopseudomonas sp. BAL398]WOK20857.1 putative DNA-binding domain-containing protein [Rhodopseudomonas sp. BAL398]